MKYTFPREVWEVLNTRIPRKLEVNCREEGDFLLVLTLGYVGSGIVALNDTAARIYRLCDGKNTIGDIIRQMKESYPDAAEDDLTSDVHQSIRDLEMKRLLTVVAEKYENRTCNTK